MRLRSITTGTIATVLAVGLLGTPAAATRIETPIPAPEIGQEFAEVSFAVVGDMDVAVGWYTALFGRRPDARPMPSLADWTVGGGATVQVVHDPARAGGGLLTLQVDDLDDICSVLMRRGVELARHDRVWAAAGHPHAVFPTSYEELLRLTGGTPAEVGNGPDPTHPVAVPETVQAR